MGKDEAGSHAAPTGASAVPVTGNPPVRRLPGHPEPLSNLGYRDTVQDLQNTGF